MPELRFELPELQYPAQLNAGTAFLDRFGNSARRRERRCILAPGGLCWSYAELARRRQPHRPRARRRARRSSREIACCCARRTRRCWPPAGSRCSRRAAIAVTTMPLYRAGELRFMMEKAQVKHALCDAAAARRAGAGVRRLRRRANALFRCAPAARSRSKRCMAAQAGRISKRWTPRPTTSRSIAFTSGTTGTPKAAMHYHRDLLAICDTYWRARAAAAPRRSLLRQPAAGVHLRSRRPCCSFRCTRRRDAAAGEGRTATS